MKETLGMDSGQPGPAACPPQPAWASGTEILSLL